jgi:DNA-binding MarR family transcriptional regulator
MEHIAGQALVLEGFSAAAVEFVNAMQQNRERTAEEAGLTPSELRALFRVAAVVSVTPKDLAEHLDMTTAAVTFISRRLVEKGLVHRVDHPNDRRSLYLELTPDGDALMAKIHRNFISLLEESTGALNDAEREHFSGMLHTVAKHMGANSADAEAGRIP